MNKTTAPITKKAKKVADNIPPAMREYYAAMTEYHEAKTDDVKKIAKDLNVSENCALDIQFLKEKGRWTLGLENKLIQLHEAGTPPNMGDFGTAVNCKFV